VLGQFVYYFLGQSDDIDFTALGQLNNPIGDQLAAASWLFFAYDFKRRAKRLCCFGIKRATLQDMQVGHFRTLFVLQAGAQHVSQAPRACGLDRC